MSVGVAVPVLDGVAVVDGVGENENVALDVAAAVTLAVATAVAVADGGSVAVPVASGVAVATGVAVDVGGVPVAVSVAVGGVPVAVSVIVGGDVSVAVGEALGGGGVIVTVTLALPVRLAVEVAVAAAMVGGVAVALAGAVDVWTGVAVGTAASNWTRATRSGAVSRVSPFTSAPAQSEPANNAWVTAPRSPLSTVPSQFASPGAVPACTRAATATNANAATTGRYHRLGDRLPRLIPSPPRPRPLRTPLLSHRSEMDWRADMRHPLVVCNALRVASDCIANDANHSWIAAPRIEVGNSQGGDRAKTSSKRSIKRGSRVATASRSRSVWRLA